MPLPAIEFALAHVVDQLQFFLTADSQTAQFSDLMMAEEQGAPFVRELGHALLTQYVATRSAQARQAPPLCDCGDAMTVHRVTTSSYKTLC
jgi:hypothetical protein